MATAFLVERRTDNRQATGHQQRSPDTLNAPGNDQLMNAGGDSASPGSPGEDCHARYKGQTAAKQVAQRAADQNQGAQEQSVRLDDPLHIHHGCVKARLDRRQSNVDNCAVDESHTGPENGCSEYPWPRLGPARNFDISGPDYGFIARWSHAHYGCSPVGVGFWTLAKQSESDVALGGRARATDKPNAGCCDQ